MAYAEELVSEHLENAARALLAECEGQSSRSASAADKQHLRCLLLAILGCLSGLGTCLPGLDPAVSTPTSTPSLSVIGRVILVAILHAAPPQPGFGITLE